MIYPLFSAEKFRIILGSDNVLQPSSGSLQIEAFRYISHPEYDPNTLKYDIGFVQLQNKVAFSGLLIFFQNFIKKSVFLFRLFLIFLIISLLFTIFLS